MPLVAVVIAVGCHIKNSDTHVIKQGGHVSVPNRTLRWDFANIFTAEYEC